MKEYLLVRVLVKSPHGTGISIVNRFHMNYPMGSNMGDNDVTITNEEAMKNKNREGGGCAAYVGLDGRCRYG